LKKTGEENMANLEQSFDARFSMQVSPSSFTLRLGRREIFVCKDFRQRPYSVSPIFDCSTGVAAGHLEILLFKKWLVILSKARW
jgi:hypothetical protein